MRRTKEFRGISVRLARNYLESLGGEAVDGGDGAGGGDENSDGHDPGVVEGDGWRARLSAEKVGIGPTLELTEVTVVFEADDGFGEERFETLIADFSRKAMRAGG